MAKFIGVKKIVFTLAVVMLISLVGGVTGGVLFANTTGSPSVAPVSPAPAQDDPPEENGPPIIISYPDVLLLDAGDSWTYSVQATDPEGDGLSYRVAGPGGMVSSGVGWLSWKPTGSDVGLHNVTVTVSDTAGNAFTQNIQLNVKSFTGKPQTTLSKPTNIQFGHTDGVLVADLDTEIRIVHPDTGNLLWGQIVSIPSLQVGEIENANLNARNFIYQAREKLTNIFTGYPLFMADLEVMNARALAADDGTVLAVPLTLSVAVEVRALGSYTNLVEKALTTFPRPDATILASTRMNLELAGLPFTDLDPSIVTFSDLLTDIETQVIATFADNPGIPLEVE